MAVIRITKKLRRSKISLTGRPRWERRRFTVSLVAGGIVLLGAALTFYLWVSLADRDMLSGAPGPDSLPFTGTAVESFQQDCEKGVNQWRGGQLDYPGELTVPMNGSVTYNAAIDIRDVPLPADQVIVTQGSVRSELIEVKCAVAARLLPVGDHLRVEDSSSDQWLTREFTPLGIVEWSWTVKAEKPVDQELRLIIRPALLVREWSVDETVGRYYSAASEASVTTRVKVDASLVQQINYWFEVQWPLLVTVFSLLGVAVTACWQWLRGFKNKDHEPSAMPPPRKPSPKKKKSAK